MTQPDDALNEAHVEAQESLDNLLAEKYSSELNHIKAMPEGIRVSLVEELLRKAKGEEKSLEFLALAGKEIFDRFYDGVSQAWYVSADVRSDATRLPSSDTLVGLGDRMGREVPEGVRPSEAAPEAAPVEPSTQLPYVIPQPSIETAVRTSPSGSNEYKPKKEGLNVAHYLGIGLVAGLVGIVGYVAFNQNDSKKTVVAKQEKPYVSESKPVEKPVEKPYVPETKPVEVIKPVEKPYVPEVKPVETPVVKKLTASELEQKLLNNVFDSQNKEAIATYKQLIAADDSYKILAESLGWDGAKFDDDKFTSYERSLPDAVRSIYDSFDEGFDSSVSNELEKKSGFKAGKNFERYMNALQSSQKQELLSETYNMKKLAVARLVEHAHKSEE